MRFCLRFRNNRHYLYIAGINDTVHLDPDITYDQGIQEVYLRDLDVHLGWNFMVFNVRDDNGTTWIQAFRRSADRTVKDTLNYRTLRIYEDSQLFYFCFGSKIKYDGAGAWTYEFPFRGILNTIGIHLNPLGLNYINDYWTFDCQEYCTICRAIDLHKCLEEFEWQLISYWDYAPFIFEPLHYDRATKYLYHKPHSPYQGEPIYVHNNGLWNDGSREANPGLQMPWREIVANFQWYQSFTIEAWVKFYDFIDNDYFLLEKLVRIYFV